MLPHADNTRPTVPEAAAAATVASVPDSEPTRTGSRVGRDEVTSCLMECISLRAGGKGACHDRSDDYPISPPMTTPQGSGGPRRSPGGDGVNRRAQIRMSEEEVEAFLAERRNMTMCTLNHDGTIHAVAMWYGFLEGCVAIETKAKSQKAVNLRRDPRLTCLMEEGDTYDQLRGVELVGRAEIVEEPERLMALGRSVFERYYGPFTDEAKPFVEAMLNKRIVVKLLVDRVVSWDHRKL